MQERKETHENQKNMEEELPSLESIYEERDNLHPVVGLSIVPFLEEEISGTNTIV